MRNICKQSYFVGGLGCAGLGAGAGTQGLGGGGNCSPFGLELRTLGLCVLLRLTCPFASGVKLKAINKIPTDRIIKVMVNLLKLCVIKQISVMMFLLHHMIKKKANLRLFQ